MQQRIFGKFCTLFKKKNRFTKIQNGDSFANRTAVWAPILLPLSTNPCSIKLHLKWKWTFLHQDPHLFLSTTKPSDVRKFSSEFDFWSLFPPLTGDFCTCSPACSCTSSGNAGRPGTLGWCLWWWARWTGGLGSCAASWGRTECSGLPGCTSCPPWFSLWRPGDKRPSSGRTASPGTEGQFKHVFC